MYTQTHVENVINQETHLNIQVKSWNSLKHRLKYSVFIKTYWKYLPCFYLLTKLLVLWK